jgi:hypothetical protein
MHNRVRFPAEKLIICRVMTRSWYWPLQNPVKPLRREWPFIYLLCLDFIFVLVLETLEDECRVTLGFVNTEIVSFRLSFSSTTIDPEMHSTRPTRRVRSNP